MVQTENNEKVYIYIYIYILLITNRCMKEWGIQIASERRMRQRVNDMRGESNLLCSEACLFSFACKSGGEERTAPLVYIPHLTAKVVEFLDKIR